MPKITVMIPMYNVEKYLKRCLDSILAQTFQDFEILLIDDGSTDNSGAIGDKYANKDNRIHIIHKKNEGQAITRNKCIDWCMKNSSSEWLTFIDSDDWIHKRYLELLLETAIKYDVSVSVCDYVQVSQMIEDEDICEDCIEKVDTEIYFVEYNLNSALPCAKLYRKDLFKEIRYPAIKLYEDECTTYKILFQDKYIAFIKFPMYYYFNNTQSVMGSTKNLGFIPEKMEIVRAFEERMRYFQKNTFLVALDFQKKDYLFLLCEYCKLILHSSNKEYYQKYLPTLRKKLRWFIGRYKKDMGITFGKNKWIYELAYPKMMYLYWMIWGRFTQK